MTSSNSSIKRKDIDFMRSMISQESDEQLRNILYQELEQIKVEDDLSEKYKIWEDEAWKTIDAEISDPLIKNTIKSHHGRTISYSNGTYRPKTCPRRQYQTLLQQGIRLFLK